MTQDLKKGDITYTYLGSKNTNDCEYIFTSLEREEFDYFGYNVKSKKGENEAEIVSDGSERIIVDLKNGTSFNRISECMVDANNPIMEIVRYTIDGKLIATPVKGLNIVRMSDGSVRKVMVK